MNTVSKIINYISYVIFHNYTCHFTLNVQNCNVKKPLLSHCSTEERLDYSKGGKRKSRSFFRALRVETTPSAVFHARSSDWRKRDSASVQRKITSHFPGWFYCHISQADSIVSGKGLIVWAFVNNKVKEVNHGI